MARPERWIWFLAGMAVGAAVALAFDRGPAWYAEGRQLVDEAGQLIERGRHLASGRLR